MDPELVWHNNAYKPTQPREYVSVDKLKSPTMGLIAQLTRRLTTKLYNIAILFVNQSNRFIYAHLQITDRSKETIKYVQVFELMAQQNGVKIKAYHTDDGIF